MATPQHNMRIKATLWEQVEREARSRENPDGNGPRYPRTWIVEQALLAYFETLKSSVVDGNGNDDGNH